MDHHFTSSVSLDRSAQLELIQNLWNRNADDTVLGNYGGYLDYYFREMKNLRFGFAWALNNSAAQTHRQLLSIVRIMSEHRDLDIFQMIQKVKEVPEFSNAPDEWVQRSIDMALRVWLTLNVREKELETLTLHTPCLQWEGRATTLNRFVAHTFPSVILPPEADASLENHFTAVNMYQSNGLRVEWTNCLVDHLSVDLEHRKVRIYYLKQCLHDHMNGRGLVLGVNGSILPKRLLLETIWTLNLLFPPDDRRTTDFLDDQKPPKRFYSEDPHEEKRYLDLNVYTYWRQRLLELRKISKMRSETITQYLHQQNPGERLNLIMTVTAGFILALIFGLITSITAIISTKATLDALEVSKEALALQKAVPICPCSSS